MRYRSAAMLACAVAPARALRSAQLALRSRFTTKPRALASWTENKGLAQQQQQQQQQQQRGRASVRRLTTAAVSELESEAVATEEHEWSVPRTRQAFVDFFAEKKAHTPYASGPVVPLSDPTLLFTNAGMNQFKSIFLGQVAPDSPLAKLTRACNSQKCIRAGGKHNDLEDVGIDTYHHTFFEMLGSWSFGDYFKEEAIPWAFELLTEVYGLDKERLYATYFEGSVEEGLEPDFEARDLWLRFLPSDRVIPGSKQDNFWEMGDSGPCGPCTELHYDCVGGRGNMASQVNMDDPSVIEIWNVVFIQFDRDAASRALTTLPAQHVDTGLGLERLVAILQQKSSNYDTDAFAALFEATRLELAPDAAAYAGLLGDADAQQGLRDTAYRAIADHVRCLAFALADGAVPSNEGRGYVLRRILRRAVRYGRQKLGANEGFFSRLFPALAESHFGDAYPELRSTLAATVEIIAEEEAQFARTLERGVRYLDEQLVALPAGGALGGDEAFFLYDSLGFPIDLTTLMAAERGFTTDAAGFESAMQGQQQQSRDDRSARRAAELGSAVIALGVGETASLERRGVAPTIVTALATDGSELEVESARVVALFAFGESGVVELERWSGAGAVGVVLETTPFYAEAGGQVADAGLLRLADGRSLLVKDTQAFAGFVLHSCVALDDDDVELVAGQTDVRASVDAARRALVVPNHSMTHVLNKALRGELGEGVAQRGSLCDAAKLRFDFAHGKAMSADQLSRVEASVVRDIDQALPAHIAVVPLAEAQTIEQLRAVFGEAYPDPVRVVAFGGAPIAEVLAAPTDARWLDCSIELCGGTHVQSTSDAVDFVITEEGAVSKGVRRIEAVTGDAAVAARKDGTLLEERLVQLEHRAQLLEKPAGDDTADDSAQLAEDSKKLRANLDATTCSAALKSRARARLETVGKALNQLAKKRRAALVLVANEQALLAADAAAARGCTSLVLRLGGGVDAKAAATLAGKVEKRHPQLAFLALCADDAAVLGFANVPDAQALGADAPTWLQAALAPLGGRGGGKPGYAQGSAPAPSVEALEAAVLAAEALVA